MTLKREATERRCSELETELDAARRGLFYGSAHQTELGHAAVEVVERIAADALNRVFANPPRKGEFVTCEAGHLVCEVVGELLPGWDSAVVETPNHPWPGLGAWRENADMNGLCTCGKPWFRYKDHTCARPMLHIKGRGWV